MDQEGITGLNPGKARSDIEKINNGVREVQAKYVQSTSNFYGELSKLWYSPKAVEFGEKIMPVTQSLDDEIVSFNDNTISSCVNAYNRIAPAHGEGQIKIQAGPYLGMDYEKMLDIGPDGKVGMQIDDVKNVVADYINQLNTVRNALPSLPESIAFYDTDGALAGSCRTNISKLRTMIDEAASKIIETVSIYIAEEAMRVEQGAANASETLRGSGGSASF